MQLSLKEISPIRRSYSDPYRFTSKRSSTPKQSPIVIVGGGLAGLLAAYYLSDLNPLLLEASNTIGGNCQAGCWDGLQYSQGASYLDYPTQGTYEFEVLSELGLLDQVIPFCGLRQAEVADIINDSLELPESINARGQFLAKQLESCIQRVIQSRELDIFARDNQSQSWIHELDKLSLAEIICAPPPAVPAELAALLENYALSTFGGFPEQISAAGALYFLSGEFGRKATFRGGLAVLAEALLHSHVEINGLEAVRSAARVTNLELTRHGVMLEYINGNRPERVLAQKVVVACNKRTFRDIYPNLEPTRRALIDNLQYRNYLVANLFLKEGPDGLQSSLFFIENRGELKGEGSDPFRITDVIVNKSPALNDPRIVLTIFCPLLPGQRYEQADHDSLKRSILKSLPTHIFKSRDNIAGFEFRQYLDALPLMTPTLLSSGALKALREPIADKIYFVQQDNWMLPSIRTCFYEADYWSGVIRASL